MGDVGGGENVGKEVRRDGRQRMWWFGMGIWGDCERW